MRKARKRPTQSSCSVGDWLATSGPDVEGVGNRGRDKIGIGDGGETDEPDAVGERLNGMRRYLEGEARLADTAGSGQREEARLWLLEHGGYRADLALAPDERRQRRGEIARAQ